MNDQSQPLAAARAAFDGAVDIERLPVAVMRFHRQVDDVLDQSVAAHGVKSDCRRGCSHCCHMQVEMLPPESFALAAWMRRRMAPERLDAVRRRLRENAERTRELGPEGRKRANIPCALLAEDGACGAYEARPAQCRRFHSLDVEVCKKSFADPADDSIESPAHPLVAHNVQVIVTLAQHGLRDRGLDAEPRDMNLALLEALDNPKAWRRWRDGKKAFVEIARLVRAIFPVLWGTTLALDFD